MEMNNLMDFIPATLLIVIAATYVAGIFLKESKFKDKYITLALMTFSITFAMLIDMINQQYKTAYEAVVYGILQGILCWGVAVGINQTTKQLKKDE